MAPVFLLWGVIVPSLARTFTWLPVRERHLIDQPAASEPISTRRIATYTVKPVTPTEFALQAKFQLSPAADYDLSRDKSTSHHDHHRDVRTNPFQPRLRLRYDARKLHLPLHHHWTPSMAKSTSVRRIKLHKWKFIPTMSSLAARVACCLMSQLTYCTREAQSNGTPGVAC